MRIAAYIHPTRMAGETTGVGKHIANMTKELAARVDIDFSLLAPASDWAAFETRAPDSPLLKCSIHQIAIRRALIEKAWSICNLPAAELWTGAVDWIYCPMEAYVPRRRKTRLALTAHAMYWFDPDLPELYRSSRVERLRWRIRIGRALRSDDVLWLVVSSFLKGELVRLFDISPDRIAVVGNGVEPEYFNPRSQITALRFERPYLLVVGGLQYWKGADHVLRLADWLDRKKSDLQIIAVGRHEPQFERAASDKKNIRLLGYLGAKNGLPELMAASVALLNLSRYDTFSIPVAEGMAAGTVVIAANNSALPEIVGDGGILVDPADTEHIYDLVTRLLNEPQYRSCLVNKGRRRASLYTWSTCCERLISALQN